MGYSNPELLHDTAGSPEHPFGGLRRWAAMHVLREQLRIVMNLPPAAIDFFRHCSRRYLEDTSGQIHTTTNLPRVRLHAHSQKTMLPHTLKTAAYVELRCETTAAR